MVLAHGPPPIKLLQWSSSSSLIFSKKMVVVKWEKGGMVEQYIRRSGDA
jgi:hypothetical protein